MARQTNPASELEEMILARVRDQIVCPPDLQDRVMSVSALRVLGTKRYNPAKIRRSMALKVSLFGRLPALDAKLMMKDQDLSFQ